MAHNQAHNGPQFRPTMAHGLIPQLYHCQICDGYEGKWDTYTYPESEEAATTEEGQPERTLTKKEERVEGVGGYVPRIGRSHDSHNQPWYSINNSDYS